MEQTRISIVTRCESCRGSGYQEHGWGKGYHLEPCRSCLPRAGAPASDCSPDAESFNGSQTSRPAHLLFRWFFVALIIGAAILYLALAESIGPVR